MARGRSASVRSGALALGAVLGAAVALASCATETAPAPATAELDLDALGTAYAAAWSGGDPQRLAAHYAPDGRLQVNDGAPAVGRDAVAAKAGAFMEAFPDMVVRMESTTREGDRVVFRWHWTGTNTGPGGNGRSVDLRGREEWTLDEDGLIVESLGRYDEAEYARQMGAGDR